MIKDEMQRVNAECLEKIAFCIPEKAKYTKKDVDRIQVESLFHRWECGTLAGQDGLCAYALALRCGLHKERMSQWLFEKAKEYCKHNNLPTGWK